MAVAIPSPSPSPSTSTSTSSSSTSSRPSRAHAAHRLRLIVKVVSKAHQPVDLEPHHQTHCAMIRCPQRIAAVVGLHLQLLLAVL